MCEQNGRMCPRQPQGIRTCMEQVDMTIARHASALSYIVARITGIVSVHSASVSATLDRKAKYNIICERRGVRIQDVPLRLSRDIPADAAFYPITVLQSGTK